MTAPQRSRGHGQRLEQDPALATGALALATVAAIVLYLYAGRGTSFFFDDWDFVLGRRGTGLDVWFEAHNGHLSLIPVVLYKLYLKLFGLDAYLPWRLTVLAVHLGSVWLLFIYARRRVAAAVALAAALALLFFGSGWENILWPFQIGYSGSIAAGLGMLLALDRRDRRGDLIAALLLLTSLACSGIGVAFLVSTLVLLLYRSERARAVRVVAVPLALYAIWYLAYGDSQTSYETATKAPQFAADMAAAASGALIGLNSSWGQVLALAGAAAVIYAIVRRERLPWAGAAVLVVPLIFWIGTGVSRATQAPPDSSRYMYVGAALILAVAVQFTADRRFNRAALACLAAVLVFSIAGNLQPLRSGSRFLRDTDTFTRAELAAVEIAKGSVKPDFRPDTQRMPQVSAGPYLDAVSDYGSAAINESELPSQSEQVREAVDGVLVAGMGLRLGPAPAAFCDKSRIVRPGAAGADLPIAHPGALISPLGGPVQIRLRRYGSAAPAKPLAVTAKQGFLFLPPDRATRPWIMNLRSARPVKVCAQTG